MPNRFLVLITSLAWMVIIPFELTSQSLLSDPEWLARHDTPPSETDEIDTDNISGYDRQVIEELMGLKPVTEEMVTEIKTKPGIRAPKLSADEAKPRMLLEPFLLENPSAETIPEVELSFPIGNDYFEDAQGVLKPEISSAWNDNSSTFPNSETARENQTTASIESVQNNLLEDPLQAKIDFEQIEHQLLLEDRARLKIKLLYHLDRLQAAEEMCRAFLKELSFSPWVPEIFYYLQLSLHGQQKLLEPNPELEQLSISSLNPELLSRLLQLFSENALEQGKISAALRYRLEEMKHPQTAGKVDEEQIIELIGQMAIPLMLITLGVAIGRMKRSGLMRVFWPAVWKFLICLICALLVVWLFNLPRIASAILILQVTTPVAVTSYLLAEKYGLDAESVAALVIVSTLLSVMFIPICLAFLI